MKKIILTLAIVALATVSSFAQKILTFDSTAVTQKFERMQAEDALLQKQLEAIREEQKKLEEELKGIVEKVQKYAQDAENTLLTDDARKNATEMRDAQAALFREKQSNAQQYLQQKAARLDQDVAAARKKYMDEVRETAKVIATEKGAGLVIEANPNSAVVFYNSPTLDITEDLVKVLNAKK